MDILTLFLLYYLAQKPELLESIKPIAELMKSSEESLKFLDNIKAFTKLFDTPPAQNTAAQAQKTATEEKTETPPEEKNRQSPFQGIADELLQQYLDEYLKNG